MPVLKEVLTSNKRKVEEDAEIEEPPRKLIRHEAENADDDEAWMDDVHEEDCLQGEDVLRRIESICLLLVERQNYQPNAFGVRFHRTKMGCFGHSTKGKSKEIGLVEKFQDLLLKDFEGVDGLDELPYDIIEPVLAKFDSRQLQMFEKLYPAVASKTDDLWKNLVRRKYPDHCDLGNRTWKELFVAEKKVEDDEIRQSKVVLQMKYKEAAQNVHRIKLVDLQLRKTLLNLESRKDPHRGDFDNRTRKGMFAAKKRKKVEDDEIRKAKAVLEMRYQDAAKNVKTSKGEGPPKLKKKEMRWNNW